MPNAAPPIVDAPLFFLDYDGTLAPIVERPMEAYPHPDVPDLLERLAARYPVLIVTGRHIGDVAVLMPHPQLRAIGLHGTQKGMLGREPESLIPEEARAAIARMRGSVPQADGISVEEKGETFAVHYREATDEAAAEEELRTWAAEVPENLEVIWGKKVAEVRPKGMNKGVAVRNVAAEYPDRVPLYLGDDVTDEDAFEALEALDGRAVTVKVGEGNTVARYRLPGPDEVVTYLQRYLVE